MEKTEKERDNFLHDELDLELLGLIEDEDDDILSADMLVSDEEVVDVDGRTCKTVTTVQYTGCQYLITVPKSIVRDTDIARKDKCDWSIVRNREDITELRVLVFKDGFRLPADERVDGR